MKKITAKHITDNLDAMKTGKHILYRGAEYWMQCDQTAALDGTVYSDPDNGTLYYISEDRKLLGSVNGYEYGKVIDGIPYKI